MSKKVIPELYNKYIEGTESGAIGKTLASGRERTGRTHIFYSSTCALSDTDLCTFRHQPVQKGAYNKTNYTKLNETKLSERINEVKTVGEVIVNVAIPLDTRYFSPK